MNFTELRKELKGDLFTDNLQRILYATDASMYRELPLAVARPRDKKDIKKIIAFARKSKSSIIPRGGGTSLAGQVVGSGIVVDVSKYMNRIIEFNPEERWVVVEPGVILAELNRYLIPQGFFFGPETSTADRCCMSGMFGNNSCGLHSLIYGSVRDHILETEVILSDCSEVIFKGLTNEEFERKCHGDPEALETLIYRNIRDTLSDPANRNEIAASFPHHAIRRRNHGYALDALMDSDPFSGNGEKINICKLLAGSEGTLAITTRMKLNIVPVTPHQTGLICAHFTSLPEALKANIIILDHNPASVELIDDFIINCTKDNITQSKNRFFIKGSPKVILLVEIYRDTLAEVKEAAENIDRELKKSLLGYHNPLLTENEDIQKVWALRKAGLGVLLNIPGEKRSVQGIEDTSVLPALFPEYFSEFEQILKKYNLNCAYYAHVATGELHFSPLLDLKDPADIKIYHDLAKDVACLVKKYRGSLSGEHGDGRLRGEFIPLMLGDHNYMLLKELKRTWDPENILNPGKIIDAPSMDKGLRYKIGEQPEPLKTTFSFPEKGALLFAVEKCSGSGDCRKSPLSGGTMCPTFMATGDEDKSTRGRANILREFLTRSERKYPWDHDEIYRVMDLCLSCKACKSECPSNVDMAKFKAEFLQHHYDIHGIPFRTKLTGWLPRINKLGFHIRPLSNYLTGLTLFKRAIGFEDKRNIPELSKITLSKWERNRLSRKDGSIGKIGKVHLFADEFTEFNESDIGIKAILLLEILGYQVIIPKHIESGRTLLSKGMLKAAKKVAERNIGYLKDIISENTPLIGLEPSAILTFRDEYPELVGKNLKQDAEKLGKNSLLIEEFLCRELDRGNISSRQFTFDHKLIKLHGHCQQKAITSTAYTLKMLSIPVNFRTEEIPSGCCGMAGAFGYEKEHYELSLKIGEMVLFPFVRALSDDSVIVAPGTSCRHQIFDGTGKKSFHPAEIMYEAVLKDEKSDTSS